MTIRADLIAHAATCREALATGQPRPQWKGADLRGAYLHIADLRGADLRGADLRDANLAGADLRSADLRGADLRDANLAGADLRSADLRDAVLTGANLTGADLRYAVLTGADLTGADLTGAEIAHGTITGALAGRDGGYRWHALRTEAGVVLQFGRDRAPLAEWREYGARYEHDEAHWATGPAVAIAAAEALLNT